MNSKLRATTGLSVRSTQGGAPLILYDQLGQGRSQVSFDPDAAAYWIESSSNTLWLSASVAEPAYAAVGLVGGSTADDGNLETEVTLDQLGETTLEVRVTAGDLTTRTYTIVATLLAKQCSPECTTAVAEDRATCDGITGECTCKAGWKGANCDADCPGDCNGVHGTCALQTNKTCICEPTYSGRGCTNRVCPACLNNATCTEAYTCSCADGFKGALCETKTCQTAVVDTPCSGHGTCNTLSAECKCAKGWVGGDCNTKKLHIKNCVAVQVWFGIEGPASNNLSAPVYDPNFDLADPAAQKWLHHVCTRARARKDLVVRSDWPCWVESFKDSVAELGMTFPIPRPLMSTAVDILYDNSNFKTLYNRQIGTAGTDYGGQMLYTYVSMRIELDNRRGNVGNLELLEHQARWQKFMLEMNADAPSSMKGGVVTSTTWTAADTEQGLIDSTLQTWAISNGGVLLVILLFTQNLLISTYAMLTIVLIVISLMGFLFAIVGFEFGAIEAVGVTIFVGMSVDYCLHVAHG